MLFQIQFSVLSFTLLCGTAACLEYSMKPFSKKDSIPQRTDTIRRVRSLADTNTVYQEFTGTFGADSAKIHIFKNKLYEHTFTASLYFKGGYGFKLFHGQTEFKRVKDGYTAGYVAGRMNSEKEYRFHSNLPFDEEVLFLMENTDDFAARLDLTGKQTDTGTYVGTAIQNRQPLNPFFFRPQRALFYPQTYSYQKGINFTIDGLIPRTQSVSSPQRETPVWLQDTASFWIGSSLLQRIHAYIQQKTAFGKTNVSYSVIYQEHNQLTILVSLFYLNNAHDGGYFFKAFNYNTDSRQSVSLEELFVKGFEEKLWNLVQPKITSHLRFNRDNFILTQVGLYFILDDKTQSNAKTLFLKWDELKAIMK